MNMNPYSSGPEPGSDQGPDSALPPEPGKPSPELPGPEALAALERLGLDPSVPRQPLNLAGADEALPNPRELAQAGEPGAGDMLNDPAWLNKPTFSAPQANPPALQGTAGLADAGIRWFPQGEPDPALPDLTQYSHPYALDIRSDPLASPGEDDPWLADILWGTRPPDLQTEAGQTALDVQDRPGQDALVAKLQPPQLEPEARMADRPGDLADDALALLRGSADYQNLPQGVSLANDYMLQPGSTHRTRREALQLLGLEAEER